LRGWRGGSFGGAGFRGPPPEEAAREDEYRLSATRGPRPRFPIAMPALPLVTWAVLAPLALTLSRICRKAKSGRPRFALLCCPRN